MIVADSPPDFDNAKIVFERTIGQEVLHSENLRTVLLIAAAILAGLISIILVSAFPQEFALNADDTIFMQIVFIVAMSFVIYLLIIRRTTQRLTEKGNRKRLLLLRYTNALVEITLSTVVLASITYIVEQPVYTLFSPGIFLYFFFIALSVLRLNFRLSVFTGMIAAIQYLGLAQYFLVRFIHPDIPAFMISSSAHIIRALMIMITGIAAGFATGQMRRNAIRSLQAIQARNRITGLFGQHVSPQVVDTLLSQGDGPPVNEVREVCIMFFDIRNFTTYSEKHNPVEIVNYLNHLFGSAIDVINQHSGIINKFLGDGFMAVFGAPLPNSNNSQQAVNAALSILGYIEKDVHAGRLPPTRVGIGLHTGPVLTGNIGSATRQEYTVIGDVVNVASRIEQLNKQFGSQILISESVRRSLNMNTPTKSAPLGTVPVRGREEPIAVFQLA